MKKLIIIGTLALTGCSSVSLVENWKDPETVLFHADKVLIVGMTQNEEARKSFETSLLKEFDQRNVEAMRSLDVFDVEFTDTRRTEEELDDVEQSLLNKDFDAILFTKIIGSEDRKSFMRTIAEWDSHRGRFNEDYFEHQSIYFDEGYYDTFKVYHAQTTLYCICEGKERAMIWRGTLEITNPKNIKKSVSDYIKLVVLALEDQDLIFYKDFTNEITGL